MASTLSPRERRTQRLPVRIRLVLAVAVAIIASIVTASAVIAGSAQPTTCSPLASYDSIDTYLAAQMDAVSLPGGALAIVSDGQVVHSRGFGRADSTGRPVTEQTPFNIASNGKSITAMAVMQLVERGDIELESPVQQYLPWFPTHVDNISSQVTVRQLLQHTSGLSRQAGLSFLRHENDSPNALDERVRALTSEDFVAQPGQQFQYSNINYSTLGLIVQTVAGQPFEEYIRNNILVPLDMTNTYLTHREAKRNGAATGYRFMFGFPRPYELPYHRGEVPAGFVWSSAENMGNFLVAQLNGGTFMDSHLLLPESVAKMHEPAVLARQGGSPEGSDEYYGMGWVSGTMNGLPIVYHTGDTPNFHSYMALLPRCKTGFILLLNGNDGLRPERVQGIGPSIASLLSGGESLPRSASGVQMTALIVTLAILGVQLLGMARSGWVVRRWIKEPGRRPRGWARVTWHLLPSLIINTLWGLVALMFIPMIIGGGSLSALIVFVPELGYLLLVSGVVALVWAATRGGLVLWSSKSAAQLKVPSST
jgi:CubicO group peptidase (beta-lactamase class C family)